MKGRQLEEEEAVRDVGLECKCSSFLGIYLALLTATLAIRMVWKPTSPPVKGGLDVALNL